MRGQVTATSKPLEQFLASHSFSPRNTRSTRREVYKEGDEKVCRRSSTEIFASFRVFRGPILSFPRGACRLGEESQDSRLVLLSRCSMQIDVPSVRHEPNLFWVFRALNKHVCVGGSRVPVGYAADDEHRARDVFDVIDGTKL